VKGLLKCGRAVFVPVRLLPIVLACGPLPVLLFLFDIPGLYSRPHLRLSRPRWGTGRGIGLFSMAVSLALSSVSGTICRYVPMSKTMLVWNTRRGYGPTSLACLFSLTTWTWAEGIFFFHLVHTTTITTTAGTTTSVITAADTTPAVIKTAVIKTAAIKAAAFIILKGSHP